MMRLVLQSALRGRSGSERTEILRIIGKRACQGLTLHEQNDFKLPLFPSCNADGQDHTAERQIPSHLRLLVLLRMMKKKRVSVC